MILKKNVFSALSAAELKNTEDSVAEKVFHFEIKPVVIFN